MLFRQRASVLCTYVDLYLLKVQIYWNLQRLINKSLLYDTYYFNNYFFDKVVTFM